MKEALLSWAPIPILEKSYLWAGYVAGDWNGFSLQSSLYAEMDMGKKTISILTKIKQVLHRY